MRYRILKKKNIFRQLVSQLLLSEIMVQGRTNIGQLVSQLFLSENVVQGEPWGFHRVLSMFRLDLVFLCRLLGTPFLSGS